MMVLVHNDILVFLHLVLYRNSIIQSDAAASPTAFLCSVYDNLVGS